MARPRDPDKLRWPSRKYVRGYCEEYQGTVYTRINGVRQSTGMRWPETDNPHYMEIRAECERILDERLAAHYHDDTAPAQQQQTPRRRTLIPTTVGPQTLFALLQEFRRVKLTAAYTTTRKYQQNFKQSFAALADRDIPLDVDVLVEHYAKRVRASSLKSSTLSKCISVHRRILAYGVDRGYIASNPITVINTPPVERRAIVIFPIDRIPDLCAYSEWRGDREAAIYWRWMFLTGMRGQESIDLRWSHITDTSMTIYGKGHMGHKRMREFPLQMSGDDPTDDGPVIAQWEYAIAEILREMRRRSTSDKVWRWPSQDAVAKVFNVARDAIGVAPTATFHTIRKAASYYWEFVLGFDAATREALAGHTEKVQKRHYRGELGAMEAAKLIDRARR